MRHMNSPEMDLSRQIYEAASSNDVDQLNSLLENENNSDDLVDLLSKVCMELQLNCVYLSDDTKLILDRKLLRLRFFDQQTKVPLSSQNIFDRIGFTIQLIRSLHNSEGDEELFIVDLTFIVKQIFTLKRLLKSTYDRLPWEEIEFCVLNYIRTFKEQNEIVLFSRAILSKSSIINDLVVFATHLEKLQKYVLIMKPQELARLPNMKRYEAVDEITEIHPEFKSLYNDHERLRDIHSLNIMLNYVHLVESLELDEKHSILILMRALQVIGEHLKNTLESPKLSQTTISFLLTSFSGSTRDIVIKLRNSLSHIQTLAKREELLESLETDFLKGIKCDIEKIGAKIDYVLSKYKIKILRELGDRFVNTNDEEVMREVAYVMKNIDINSISRRNFSELKNNDVTRLKELIGQFRSKITLKSGYGEFLFATIDYTLKECPEEKPVDYTKALMPFRGLCEKFYIFFEDTKNRGNFIRIMKFAMSQLLSDLSPQIEPSKLNVIVEMIISINSLLPEESEDTEVSTLFLKIIHIAKFEVNSATWAEKFGRKLRRKESEENIMNESVDEVTKKQKYDKLAQLTEIFKNMTYSEYKENKKLQAVLEVMLLDLIPMFKYPNLRSRLLFLDESYPTVMGLDLRNHLAHNNVVVEVLLDSTRAMFLFAEQLLEFETFNFKDLRFLNISFVEKCYSHSIDVLRKKQEMFKALKDNNIEAFCECYNNGADIRSRDLDMSTCLHFAMNKPDTMKITKFLWKKGLSSKLKNLDGQTPLHIAALKRNLQVVEFLLNNFEFDVNEADSFKITPSHLAALSGNERVLNILLNHGADLTKKDSMWYSPLQYALMSGKPSVVEVFFKIDLFNQLNECFGGYTAVHIAADHGSHKVVEYLLTKKLKVDARQDIGATPLHLAALNGHLECVKVLIRFGADVNSRNMNGNGAMHWACETNREEIVKVLIKNGADVNMVDHEGFFAPIHYVTKDGFVSILEILLENNANVNLATKWGLTPLYYAVQGRHLNVVEILLNQKDIKVNSADITGMTPLHVAASNGDTEIVKLLIKNGAKVNCKNMHGMNPLHLAAKFGHEAVVDILLANKVSVQARTTDENMLPLHLAAESGNEYIIKKLLEEWSDINALTANGSNCLHIAIKNNTDIADLLIREGIKVNVKTEDHGFSPLHEAVLTNNLKMVETLLNAGAHIDSKDRLGNTPIHLAIERESSEIFMYLVENGAKFTIENKMGETPFLTAVKHNMIKFIQLCMSSGLIEDHLIYKSVETAICEANIYIVKLLLEQSDLDLTKYRDPEGNTLLHLAVTFGRVDSVELLLNYDFDVNLKNDFGETALCIASCKGWDEILEILLRNGADINVQDSDGVTPLHKASLHNHSKCARILLEHGADLNTVDNKNRLAVELAVSQGHLELIEIFLQKNKNHLNRKGTESFTMLHIAAQFGQAEVVKYLLKQGADMNFTNEKGSKPIHIAAREGFTNIVDIFIDEGMDLDVRGITNNSLLHYAAASGRVKVVKHLLKRGCNVNSVNDQGITPLHTAVLMEFKEVVKCLLNNGAIFNMKHPIKEVIDLCAEENIKKILSSVSKLFSSIADDKVLEFEALIKVGVPLNCLDINKGSPLHFAVYKGNTHIVQTLLDNNVWTNATHKNGWTPLHYAVKYSHSKIVFLLLWHGAKYDISSENNKKPLDFAENLSVRNLLQLITDCFEGVQTKNSNMISRLKKVKDENIIKAVMRAKDKTGATLVTSAIKNKFSKIQELEEIFQDNLSVLLKRADGFVSHEKYREANEIYTLIYEKRKSIFGEYNPATLSIKSKIATVLYKLQKYQNALDMIEDIYQKLKKTLGPHHERALKERSNIALILHRQGKSKEALEMLEEVHKVQKHLIPPEHEDSLNTLKNIAMTLMSLDKFDRALEIYKTALQIDIKKYGLLHPFTLVAKNNIALIFSQKGENDKALSLFEEVYEARKLVLGPYHSDTLRALHNRINILKDQEKFEEGYEAFEKLLKCQKQHLGLHHLDTLNTQFHMADLRMKQAKFFAAFKIMKEIREHKIAIEGPNHVDVQIINARLQAIVEQYRKIGIHSNLNSFAEKLVSTMNNAAKNGDIETIEKLIQSGVSVGEKDPEGRNALHYAVDGNRLEVVKLLLENNADITEKTNKGNTVLHTACNKGYYNITEHILNSVHSKKMSYLINAATNTGKMTALHIAAKQGFVDLVKLLLQRGAIYNCVNKDGKKPIDLTEDKSVKHILQLTEEVFAAANKGDFKVIAVLDNSEPIDILCVTNARDTGNCTLLHLLISKGHAAFARDVTALIKKMDKMNLNS